MRERLGWIAVLGGAFLVGYFGLAAAGEAARPRGLETVLDARLPFARASVHVYVTVYSGLALPLFVVRSPLLFRRVAIGYAAVLIVSFIGFAAFPLSSEAWRAPIEWLDSSHYGDWLLALVYRLDPPRNLFPSLHVAIATLAAASSAVALPASRPLVAGWVLVVAVSTVTTRQHYALDALAGIALGAAVAVACLRSSAEREEDGPLSYGWKGLAAYAAFHAALVLGSTMVWSLGA